MEPARRFRALVGVSGVLLLIAVLADRVLPLVGASVLASALLISQWHATSRFVQTHDELSVTAAVTTNRVIPDGDTEVTVTAVLDKPTAHPFTLNIEYGPGVDGPEDALHFARGDTQNETIHEVTFPVAGQFTIPHIVCVFESVDGLVTEEIPVDTGVDVFVEPPEPTNIHVGAGGRRMASTYGEHRSGSTGSGIELAELREYLPGDGVGKIDWKATARLDEPYVREFEAETNRLTHLVFDARKTMRTGQEGRSKLEYQREVAMGMIEAAATAKDPVSLTVIDDRGIHEELRVTETARHYTRLKQKLRTLTIDPDEDLSSSTSMATTGPADAREVTSALDRLGTEFEELLVPYFADATSYIERLADDPLYEVLRRHTAKRRGQTWTLIFTDDTDPHRTLEAAKLAAREGSYATLFLAPTVLFEPDGLRNGGKAHERYVDFEDFRRQLASISRVMAYEVGPGDRLETVLTTGEGRTRGNSKT